MSSIFDDICKKNNLKMTPQRMIIYKILKCTDSHPTIETVYNEVKKTYPNISFDTVYRTLITFVNIGAASSLVFTGEVRRFDGDTEPHIHFRCKKCNEIIDIYEDEQEISLKESEELNKKGLKVQKKYTIFEGYCTNCS